MRSSLFLLSCALLTASACAGERLYVAGGGETLYAVDLESGQVAWEAPLADHSGGAGVAVSPDGRTLFVADGEVVEEFQLRAHDAATGEQTAVYPLPDRLQQRGGGNPLTLTPDGRWLLAETYDYAAAASGVRVFDVERREYRQVGLRARACAAPELAAPSGATLIVGCPGLLQRLEPLDPVPGEWRQTAATEIQLENLGALAADAAGVAYALGLAEPGRPLRLARWDSASGQPQSTTLDAAVDDTKRAALAVAPDGSRIAVAVGERLFLLDAELAVVAERDLSWEAEPRAAFSPDGSRLYLMRRQPGGEAIGPAAVLELGRNGAPGRELTLDAVRLPGPVSAFLIAPSP